ncbi:MAG: hypothetical protein Q8O64_17235 [Sideroxyarcus sp.]|nr:hypothetical protein [Sideroxyarcus sp.]
MKKMAQQSSSTNKPMMIGKVREIIRNARGSLTQTGFVDLLKEQYEIKTSQGLISKYESGITNPPADLIDKCIEIIHSKNVDGDISLTALEMRMRKVLRGPSQAGARKAFAVILDSLA